MTEELALYHTKNIKDFQNGLINYLDHICSPSLPNQERIKFKGNDFARSRKARDKIKEGIATILGLLSMQQ